jgi:hypothetical protein
MDVTESRPTRTFASQVRTWNLVTLVSPVPAGGAATEPRRCWPCWRCVPATSLAPRASYTHVLMANVDPSQIPVPQFLNPIFSYISSCLPPPVSSALLTLMAHGLAFISALLGLGTALISSKPSDWDAQKIIPPLITLLAAYLALASAVRTATWFVRTTAWLVKWGVIAAAVSAVLAWSLGAGSGGGVIVPSLVAMVSDMLSGRWKDAFAGGSRSNYQRSSPRPHAWDSFEQHWEWQFEEEQWNAANPASPAAHVQQFVADALNRAKDRNWLSIARGALRNIFPQEQTGESGGDSRDR